MPTARIEIENANNQWVAEVESGGIMCRRGLVRGQTFEEIMATVMLEYEKLSDTPLNRDYLFDVLFTSEGVVDGQDVQPVANEGSASGVTEDTLDPLLFMDDPKSNEELELQEGAGDTTSKDPDLDERLDEPRDKLEEAVMEETDAAPPPAAADLKPSKAGIFSRKGK